MFGSTRGPSCTRRPKWWFDFMKVWYPSPPVRDGIQEDFLLNKKTCMLQFLRGSGLRTLCRCIRSDYVSEDYLNHHCMCLTSTVLKFPRKKCIYLKLFSVNSFSKVKFVAVRACRTYCLEIDDHYSSP